MNRRTALLTGCAMLANGTTYGHRITSKQIGERCTRSNPCSMCIHNQAHRDGLEHDENGWYDPRTRQRKQRSEFTAPEHSPTPQPVVEAMLAVIRPTAQDTLLDPGCGDGRIVTSAARDYGCHAVGYEIDEELAEAANRAAASHGLGGRVAIIPGDSRSSPLLGGFTIVVMYLYSDLIEELMPKFTKARIVASYQHKMPVETQERYEMRGDAFYVWSR